MANGSPSPGWYQDPKDSGTVRWWDGGQWTEHTQPMPGAAPTPEPPAAATDPWAAAQQEPQWGVSQQPEAPEQAWGQQPQQPEQAWGQQPQQPEQAWGQQPQQPEQQWGQQPQQPEQAWGQQPQQPEQTWGQQPQQPEQAWGQQPQQPAAGGWQQQAGPGWGSTVPPAPVPGGLAPGSPMGQTNVFPTAETVDPITGMPVGTGEGGSGSGSGSKRLAALVVGALLVGLLIIGLLWFFLFRDTGDSAGASTGPVNVTATFTGTVDPACADLGAALTADGLTDSVVNRLNDVAIGKDLEENEAYFTQLSSDITPIMDQYESACIAAVSAGNAPEFYRTFVETFQASVTDGADVASTALADGGQVPPADAERLRAEASKLSAAGEAVMAITGTPSPTPSVTTTSPDASPSVATPSPAATSLAP